MACKNADRCCHNPEPSRIKTRRTLRSSAQYLTLKLCCLLERFCRSAGSLRSGFDQKADCARKILLILIHKIGNLSPGSHTGLQLRRTFADPAAMAFAHTFEAQAQVTLCQVHRVALLHAHIALRHRLAPAPA